MAGSTGDTFDVETALASSMVKRVLDVKGRSSREKSMRTIHRVPSNIRARDEDAYSPKIISIGPYHRDKKALKAMEEHKWRYLDELLGYNLETNIANCVRALKALEQHARGCYSESIDLDSSKFMETMMLDGCFIIQFLIQSHTKDSMQKKRKEEAGDPIHEVRWASPLIKNDLLLFENQIPFFVLEALFDTAVKPRGNTPPLMNLALSYLTDRSIDDKPCTICSLQPHHLLHLFHSYLVPAPRASHASSYWQLLRILLSVRVHGATKSDASEEAQRTIPSAAELRAAGVRFRKKEAATSFLDVTFNDSVLEMPLLSVDNSTNPLFRNLIAFEQCCPTVQDFFTWYAVLFDELIDTSRDVAILHHRGIIENKLGSDKEVALLFNRLLQEVTVDFKENYYAELFTKVHKHCGSKWNKWRAKLMHDYFGNPWSIISLLAATILLLLTIVQTFVSVKYPNRTTTTPSPVILAAY